MGFLFCLRDFGQVSSCLKLSLASAQWEKTNNAHLAREAEERMK